MRASLSIITITVLTVIIPCASGLDIQVVDDWGYQLQNYPVGLSELRGSEFDLVVIDYSRFGDAVWEWSSGEIADLRTGGPCGDRIVLAYFSIGEAEDYRFYWDTAWVDGSGDPIPGVAPAWLGPQNPDWAGNYKVRYWLAEWQAVLFGTSSGPDTSYLDRILSQGFDGIYLDIVDAFEYWGPSEIGGSDENRAAGSDMITLVESLAAYARSHGHPNFLVVPQNGSYIIDPDVYPDAPDPVAEAAVQKARYFSFINAIGSEDAFYIGPADENNPYTPDIWTIALLNEFRDAGLPVLSIEYLTQANLIQDFYMTYAPAQGYVPYASVRGLDQMTINTGFEPDCESTAPALPTMNVFGILFLLVLPIYGVIRATRDHPIQKVKNDGK